MMSIAGNPLGTERVGTLILKFAIPGIVTQLINSAHNIIDQIFIGQGFGELGIAATNIAFPLTSIIVALSALIGMGAASKFSILLGKNDREEASSVLGTALFLLVVLGGLISICASLFLDPMLRLFGATDLMMPYSREYVRILSIGVLFGVFSTGTSYFIRADGDPNYSSIVLLSGAVFNMIFDPIFLYVLHTGIWGIALATVLGQLLSTVLALVYLGKKFRAVSVSFQIIRLDMAAAKAIVSLGFAIFTTHVLMIIVQIIQMNAFRIYGAMSEYGSEIAIAGAGAVSKLSIVFLSSIIGISIGCQPIYGFNFGNKKYDRVKETYKKALKYGTVIAAAFLILQLFPRQLLVIFSADDPMFYEFSIKYIRIALAVLFLNALQPITSTFCTSIGKAKIGFWMALIRQGCLLIPLLLVLPKYFRLTGVLAAMPIADGIAAGIVLFFGIGQLKELSKKQSETQD